MVFSSVAAQARAYISLVKPGIIMGNAITAAGGFALASRGNINGGLFAAALTGLALIIASACAFNNYIDREADQKMSRTQHRALAQGAVSVRSAIAIAIGLGIGGIVVLAWCVNLLTMGIALLGLAVYVLFYSFLKYRTVHATLIGSIAGAVPPVVGYCAVSNCIDFGAILLFALIALWQMPHFYAIAIYRSEDYSAADIPVLPLEKGIPATKTHMLCYTIAFALVSLALPVFKYTGLIYAIAAAFLGLTWIAIAVQGFKARDDKQWARKMFIFSLIVVTVLCTAMVL